MILWHGRMTQYQTALGMTLRMTWLDHDKSEPTTQAILEKWVSEHCLCIPFVIYYLGQIDIGTSNVKH